jgi:hypothetical protein
MDGQDVTNMFDQEILRIASEGRKYNVGVCVLCRKPSELDHKLLSQCIQKIPLCKDKFLFSTCPILSSR